MSGKFPGYNKVKNFDPNDCVIIRSDRVYSNHKLNYWLFAVKTINGDTIEWTTDCLIEAANRKQIKKSIMDFLSLHPDAIDKQTHRKIKIDNLLK